METMKLIVDGKRLDGRALDELRPITIKAGVLNKADGSAYIEWGNNKILAAVYGPREVIPKHLANPYRAILRCRYSMAPFCSFEEHSRPGPSRRSTEISKVIREVFENVVMTEYFPKTTIDIFMEVLQAEGGTRIASLTAAAVALADAGIPMRDVPCGVAVGKIDGQLILDVGKYEDNLGESDVPIAFSPRNGDVLLLQMDGILTREEFAKLLEMSYEASKKVNALQINALRDRYLQRHETGASEG